MHRLRLACFCLASIAVRPLFAALDPPSLARELRHDEARLDAGYRAEVLAALPPLWNVSAGQKEYTISTRPLRTLLESASNGDNRAPEAQVWLEHLAVHLETSSVRPEAGDATDGALERILERPEFAFMKPPSAWDRLRERMNAWIVEFLSRIFQTIARYPTESRVFFWVLLAGVLVALAWWLLRRWSRDGPLSLKLPSPVPSRTADQWLLAAKAASDRGDFRAAIQCAYWAGVTRMEDRGLLLRNRAQTPRETLRAATKRNTGSVSSTVTPLSALTSCLERFWYAGLPARHEDFSACVKALETLGCRLD